MMLFQVFFFFGLLSSGSLHRCPKPPGAGTGTGAGCPPHPRSSPAPHEEGQLPSVSGEENNSAHQICMGWQQPQLPCSKYGPAGAGGVTVPGGERGQRPAGLGSMRAS